MIHRRTLRGLMGPNLVSSVSRWGQDLGSEFALDGADRYRIDLCLEELVTNLVKYGGESGSGTVVELAVEVDGRQLRLTQVDRGAPFDPLEFTPVEIPGELAELQVGGRGIQLLREFSDGGRYEHRDGCNRLTLTFDLAQSVRPPRRVEGIDRVAIFRDVPEGLVDGAIGDPTVWEVADDLQLLGRGDVNDSVLVLLSGEMRIFLDRPDGTEFISVAPGECVGEMSVIDDQPVSAYVQARAGARLLVIDSATFLERVIAIPRVSRNLISAQAERMRRSDALTVERMRKLMAMEQAQREMDFARDIQASLLPAEPLFADEPRVDCVGRMRPAREVGGDFYDVFFLDDRHLLFIVADVCGKGLPAALFMVRAIAALRAQPRQQAPTDGHVSKLMANLNEQLCEHNAALQYLTAFCGLLDLETYQFSYINAGHNPPLLSVGGAPFDYLREPVNPPIGMVPGLTYRTGAAQLEPGSRLLVYTDGVTEAEDVTQDMLGEDRLLARVRSMPRATSQDLVDAVFAEVDGFAGDAQQSDDITVLSIG
jgi:sigma-B regulation protein RsbU (phosphoserine phosphatase)